MAGYSGKPLAQELGIKPGFCIFVSGAPASYRDIAAIYATTLIWPVRPSCRRSNGAGLPIA